MATPPPTGGSTPLIPSGFSSHSGTKNLYVAFLKQASKMQLRRYRLASLGQGGLLPPRAKALTPGEYFTE